MSVPALILACVTFVSTSAGGVFALRFRNKLHLMMGFGAGVLVTAAFLDLLPEAIDVGSKVQVSVDALMLVVVAGFFAFHILERFVAVHSCPEGDCHAEQHQHIGLLGAGGLSFHSFLDGVAIGAGFQVNTALGILIALAVITHDFSDGLNTVIVMLANKNSSRRSLLLLAVDAITPVLGVLSAQLFTIPQGVLAYLLAFFAGFFLYIGASDMLPEAHREKSSLWVLGTTLLGVTLMVALTRIL
jgi:zinc transporter ZupT